MDCRFRHLDLLLPDHCRSVAYCLYWNDSTGVCDVSRGLVWPLTYNIGLLVWSPKNSRLLEFIPLWSRRLLLLFFAFFWISFGRLPFPRLSYRCCWLVSRFGILGIESPCWWIFLRTRIGSVGKLLGGSSAGRIAWNDKSLNSAKFVHDTSLWGCGKYCAPVIP